MATRKQASPGSQRSMTPRPETIREGYRGSGKLEGKVALVTGGDSGIGRSVAVHFAREGADVAILYLSEDGDARDTADMVEAEGRRCLQIRGDARREALCRSAVARTVKTLGRLDVLVNNLADHVPQDTLEEITPAQLRDTFENNVYPFFHLSRHALAHMQEGSAIINTGSVTSFRGSDHLIDYAATKGAIETFTYSLAKNVVDRGIRVNGVAPGPIWTPLITSSFNKKQQREFGRDTPMKRPGQPSELGPAYVYLACDDSSYVTGQFLHVNGGGFIG
ncbi:SDR family oxidoreductase [Lysobacter sp. A3-1-A15]|uniref:SDR family oxidoreductase n=1 Tax=Novilysobacter viscosus TaxID=3098602 RepID=UPI002ED9DAFD